jgi:hypothetical protein
MTYKKENALYELKQGMKALSAAKFRVRGNKKMFAYYNSEMAKYKECINILKGKNREQPVTPSMHYY